MDWNLVQRKTTYLLNELCIMRIGANLLFISGDFKIEMGANYHLLVHYHLEKCFEHNHDTIIYRSLGTTVFSLTNYPIFKSRKCWFRYFPLKKNYTTFLELKFANKMQFWESTRSRWENQIHRNFSNSAGLCFAVLRAKSSVLNKNQPTL